MVLIIYYVLKTPLSIIFARGILLWNNIISYIFLNLKKNMVYPECNINKR